jgi:hypothetical protein
LERDFISTCTTWIKAICAELTIPTDQKTIKQSKSFNNIGIYAIYFFCFVILFYYLLLFFFLFILIFKQKNSLVQFHVCGLQINMVNNQNVTEYDSFSKGNTLFNRAKIRKTKVINCKKKNTSKQTKTKKQKQENKNKYLTAKTNVNKNK